MPPVRKHQHAAAGFRGVLPDDHNPLAGGDGEKTAASPFSQPPLWRALLLLDQLSPVVVALRDDDIDMAKYLLALDRLDVAEEPGLHLAGELVVFIG